MADVPTDWMSLLILVFVLGLKHGMDADHLTTIDGLTRFNSYHGKEVSRWCGFLFSLGHGAIVVIVSLAIGAFSTHMDVPQWVEGLGAWISIGFLTLLGLINLRAVLTTPGHEVVQTVGFKGRFLGRLQRTDNPFFIIVIGALFALSFDTLSQATLYGVLASRFGGWQYALALGWAFMLGMMATDGVNGLWISRLLRRSDRTALIASRVMGLTVGGLSLLVAAFGAAKYFSTSVSEWSEGKEIYCGMVAIAVVALSFIASRSLVRATTALSTARGA